MTASANKAETKLAADRLMSVMIETSEGYFLGGDIVGTESREHFREILRLMRNKWPNESNMIVAAGLMSAGFTIDVKMRSVVPPAKPPEQTLDSKSFLENWYMVAPTIIQMGLGAIQKTSNTYNEPIAKFVQEQVV